MNISDKNISLENIGNGSIIKAFDNELKEVIRNIKDPNTEQFFKREINIKIKFCPTEEREETDIEIQVTKKLAPIQAYVSKGVIDINADGNYELFEIRVARQLTFSNMA